MNGVLVVDKTGGRTSHDVCSRARRALGTRAVGHAGTLDPMATGVLVLAVGEATKLVPFLTADDKEYEATVRFGAATDTLDAEGVVVAEAPLPTLTPELVGEALEAFLGERDQEAPVVSAIKVDGRPLHERVRRGEDVVAPIRRVLLRECELRALRVDEVDLRVLSGKGFYVRSLARDLGVALGSVAHLSSLRRTRSGAFDLGEAVPYAWLEDTSDGARERLAARLLPISVALAGYPRVALTEEGTADARHGRAIPGRRVVAGELPDLEEDTMVVLFDGEQRVVALARLREGALRVFRGFREPQN